MGRFQLYQRITARENRAVVNRFKLLLFHSFSTKSGTTPLASTFTVERQTTKRPFHSFTSSVPKSITKEGDGTSAAPFSTAKEEEPTASPRLGSQEEKNAGEIEILPADSEEATNNDQAAVGPNLQDPLSSKEAIITAGTESSPSNNESLVAEASGSNGGNRGSKIRYRVKAISLDFMGRNDFKTKAKSILDYSSLVIAKFVAAPQ